MAGQGGGKVNGEENALRVTHTHTHIHIHKEVGKEPTSNHICQIN